MPRLLLVPDMPDWALHTIAKAIETHIADDFACDYAFSKHTMNFRAEDYDIIHLLHWRAQAHLPLLQGTTRVVKSVNSHRWAYEGMTAEHMCDQHLHEADCITVPSQILAQELSAIQKPIYQCPEGVDTSLFCPTVDNNSGPLIVGWAGKPQPIKQLGLLERACDGLCELRIADGSLTQEEMVAFYQNIDVIVCCSISEGNPRPLLEGMACGAFPVSFRIGIAPELITNGNGIIVEEQSVSALRDAIEKCTDDVDRVRSYRDYNRDLIVSERSWEVCVPVMEDLYRNLL